MDALSGMSYMRDFSGEWMLAVDKNGIWKTDDKGILKVDHGFCSLYPLLTNIMYSVTDFFYCLH